MPLFVPVMSVERASVDVNKNQEVQYDQNSSLKTTQSVQSNMSMFPVTVTYSDTHVFILSLFFVRLLS